MQLVIAEKPSVGVALAKALGVPEKKDGYIEGNGYIVSWCVGYFVSIANANMYDEKFKKWDIADLPIIPDEWQFIIAEDSCLFHEDRNPSMKLYDDHFYCFGCGKHGDVTDMVGELFGLSR